MLGVAAFEGVSKIAIAAPVNTVATSDKDIWF